MMSILIEKQYELSSRPDSLLAMGLPDWRAEALSAAIDSVIVRTTNELSGTNRLILQRFSALLPQRFAQAAQCGLPDTLVHGDFHPGNFRGEGENLTLLDWGDSGVGNPLLDQPAFLNGATEAEKPDLQAEWTSLLLARFPGSEPERAEALLAPVAAARQAVIYRKFLDNIEPAEHAYHASDPANWLNRSAEILGAEPPGTF